MNSRRTFAKVRRLDDSSSSSSPELRRSDPVFVGILTISDRCSRGEKADLSGPNLQNILQDHDGFRSVVRVYKIVADEEDQISSTLIEWSDKLKLGLIVTTGGTGMGPRDVTPEATARVLEKEAPGFQTAIITASLKVTPDAMVTRLKCGTRGKTLIINVPGSKKASAECLNVVLPAVPHALECLENTTRRVCSCTAAEDYPDIGTKRKPVSKKDDGGSRRLQDNDGPKLRGEESCSHHTISYKPTILSVTEDDIMQNDASLENALSGAMLSSNNTVPPFSEASGSQQEGVSQSRSSLAPNESTACTVEEAMSLIKRCSRALDSEEISLLDACGRILTEDIALTRKNKNERQLQVSEQAQNVSINSMGGDFDASTFLDSSANEGTTESEEPILITRGTKLEAYQIGLLSGEGLQKCKAFQVPKVGVLSIGDKETAVANHVTLQIYLQQNSIKAVDLGITSHSVGVLSEIIRSSMPNTDITVISSKAESSRDIATTLITKIFGGTVHFKSVSMSPWGKSLFITTERNGKQNLFFIFPDAPVASTLCSLFLMPAYRRLAGYDDISNKYIKAKFPKDKALRDDPEYLQCTVNATRRDGLPLIENIFVDKNALQSQFGANAIVALPARTSAAVAIRKGDEVDVLLMSNQI